MLGHLACLSQNCYFALLRTAGAGDLPAFPVRVACDIMVGSGTLDGEKLMAGKHDECCLCHGECWLGYLAVIGVHTTSWSAVTH
jgi:hypothetical protein